MSIVLVGRALAFAIPLAGRLAVIAAMRRRLQRISTAGWLWLIAVALAVALLTARFA